MPVVSAKASFLGSSFLLLSWGLDGRVEFIKRSFLVLLLGKLKVRCGVAGRGHWRADKASLCPEHGGSVRQLPRPFCAQLIPF